MAVAPPDVVGFVRDLSIPFSILPSTPGRESANKNRRVLRQFEQIHFVSRQNHFVHVLPCPFSDKTRAERGRGNPYQTKADKVGGLRLSDIETRFACLPLTFLCFCHTHPDPDKTTSRLVEKNKWWAKGEQIKEEWTI